MPRRLVCNPHSTFPNATREGSRQTQLFEHRFSQELSKAALVRSRM